jgi:hypothetical protein
MRVLRWLTVAALATVGGVGVFGSQGCGTDGTESVFDGGASSSGNSSSGASSGIFPPDDSGTGEGSAPCRGLECLRVSCTSGPKTSIKGRIFEPAGKIPLYNIIVYIPNAPLPAITHGASCDKCGSLAVSPVVSAITDEKGDFVLDDVPVSDKIPLVIQVGKWRRAIEVKVEACKENTYNKKDASGNEDVMRLPRNQDEGELPQMAVSTGSADPLPCLLPRIGIDPKEFTNPTGTGRVHVFHGNGGNVAGASNNESNTALWNSTASLSKYDMVLLSCEGAEHNETKSPAQMGFLRDYLNVGGRVFATHYHYTWFKNGPADLQSVATWGSTAGARNGAANFSIDTSFPKGASFGKWLQNNGSSPDGANMSMTEVAYSITQHSAASASQWVYTNAEQYKTKYMSFNTPVGLKPEDQCGKGVLSDIHVSAGTNATTIPTTCGNADLTPQEKALLFLLMDLSSCVQDDKVAPKPPPPR